MKLIQFSSKREIKYMKENYAVDVVQRKTENACLEHFGERRTDNIKTSRTTVQRRYKSRFKRGMLQKLERLQIWSALYKKQEKLQISTNHITWSGVSDPVWMGCWIHSEPSTKSDCAAADLQ